MSVVQCMTCRWWNGDREYAPRSYHEEDKRGKCQHIIGSPALSDDWPARLYPVGVNAWLETRYDFSCRDWEKSLADVNQQ